VEQPSHARELASATKTAEFRAAENRRVAANARDQLLQRARALSAAAAGRLDQGESLPAAAAGRLYQGELHAHPHYTFESLSARDPKVPAFESAGKSHNFKCGSPTTPAATSSLASSPDSPFSMTPLPSSARGASAAAAATSATTPYSSPAPALARGSARDSVRTTPLRGTADAADAEVSVAAQGVFSSAAALEVPIGRLERLRAPASPASELKRGDSLWEAERLSPGSLSPERVARMNHCI